ncbi:MAG: hypothetical protein EHM40_01320 [Chloroflexi bacterium]|nr:MAG: hypothetical protein EHM40_10940 [Chloroflexota bacterium]RPI96501.1 MAG: hypothetical protein EHM40_01320 [Chloroflexota bacterium]
MVPSPSHRSPEIDVHLLPSCPGADTAAPRGPGGRYYPYRAARADLLRRMDQREAAADAYKRALDLCSNRAERAYLQPRLDERLDL